MASRFSVVAPFEPAGDQPKAICELAAGLERGDPVEYRQLMVSVRRGERRGRDSILSELVRIQYGRNDASFEPGTFRVRGDCIEIFPAYAEQAVRVELWGDEVERISKINPLTG